MKINEYNEMMAYLTKPDKKPVTPERKPKKSTREAYKEYLEIRPFLDAESQMFIEKELGFAMGGSVETPKRGLVDEPGSYAGDDEYGKFIRERRSKYTGKITGFDLRSSDTAYTKKPFRQDFKVSEYGSVDKALEAAKKTRAKVFPAYLSNEKFMQLRKEKINLTNREFANYLNNETPYRPSGLSSKGEGTGKWTNRNIKTKMGALSKKMPEFADVKSKFVVPKKEVPADIADEIYEKYLKAVKEGKREGTIIGLGREYFPGETRDSQQKAIQRILREKGEDITKFKKTGPGISNKKTKTERIKNLIVGKKFAGTEAGQLSDEILLDIKFMNEKVKNMSLEDIAANKKYIMSMRINASMDNLSKGKLTFDKYKDLTDLEVAQKIKDRAAANKFFDVEHISSVKGKAKNIYYPNNIQMATGNIGSFMDNFKRIPIEQPNNSVIPKIDKLLSNYNLTVRDAKNNIRLGNKAVIEVTDGVSNIVRDNFNAVDTVFEKQKVVKPTGSKSAVTKQRIIGPSSKGVTLGSNFANVNPELLDFRKLPGDVSNLYRAAAATAAKSPATLNALRKARAAAKFTGLGLAGEAAFTAPFALSNYAAGKSGKRILGDATYGLFGQTENEELKDAVGELGFATKTLDDLSTLLPAIEAKYNTFNDQNDPRGEKRNQFKNLYEANVKKYDDNYNLFTNDQGEFNKDLYQQAVNNYKAGVMQIQKFDNIAKQQRADMRTGLEVPDIDLNFFSTPIANTPAYDFAGGGIAKLAGKSSGPPPESGPTPQGLDFLLKRGR
tara:strand:+ start:2899 stop:5244 length:2346 start_codon:yes stop_codon:yes gene_type:complete